MRSLALVALEDWMSTAQLPQAFAELGVKVVALCKPEVPLNKSRHLAGAVIYTGEIASDLERLIADFDPAVLIACDEDAVRAIFSVTDAPTLSPRLHRLLRTSFGRPSGHSIVTSKWKTSTLAEQVNVRTPTQIRVDTPDQAMAFAHEFGYPIILKQENTYGGKGCYICRSDRETLGIYVALRLPRVLRKLRRIPRILAFLDPFLARVCTGSHNPVIVQRYHEGQLAFCAAVARDGVMLGGFSVVAERVNPAPTGPSTVVKAIKNPEMLQATQKLIQATGLSGFVGVDFVLDRTDGLPYLLEINPRVTAVCRLGDMLGTNICSLFVATFAGGVRQRAASDRTSDTIALFPYEWIRAWRSPYLREVFVDVPYEDPGLLAHFKRCLPLGRKIMLAIGLRGTLPRACWARRVLFSKLG